MCAVIVNDQFIPVSRRGSKDVFARLEIALAEIPRGQRVHPGAYGNGVFLSLVVLAKSRSIALLNSSLKTASSACFARSGVAKSKTTYSSECAAPVGSEPVRDRRMLPPPAAANGLALRHSRQQLRESVDKHVSQGRLRGAFDARVGAVCEGPEKVQVVEGLRHHGRGPEAHGCIEKRTSGDGKPPKRGAGSSADSNVVLHPASPSISALLHEAALHGADELHRDRRLAGSHGGARSGEHQKQAYCRNAKQGFIRNNDSHSLNMVVMLALTFSGACSVSAATICFFVDA